jgi:hypothetical protein
MLCRRCRPPRRPVPTMCRMLAVSMTYSICSVRCRCCCSVDLFPGEWPLPSYEEVSIVDAQQPVDEVAKGSANCDRRTPTTPPSLSVSHCDAQFPLPTSSPSHLRPNVRRRSPSPVVAANTTTVTKRPLLDGLAVGPALANSHIG